MGSRLPRLLSAEFSVRDSTVCRVAVLPLLKLEVPPALYCAFDETKLKPWMFPEAPVVEDRYASDLDCEMRWAASAPRGRMMMTDVVVREAASKFVKWPHSRPANMAANF